MVNLLNRILPLQKLEILEISDSNILFDELINVLYSAPKLHTLKVQRLTTFNLNLSLVEQQPIIQSIIRSNKIKTFHLVETCSLQTLKLILILFPNIEHLTIGMNTRDIDDILRELFTNNNHHHLKFICFTQTPQRCLKEIDYFLTSHGLLRDYSIKLLNRHLFLWW